MPKSPAPLRRTKRLVLSPYARRMEIKADALAKFDSAASVERSLRRRLTALDRALSDSEALALDRIISAFPAAGNSGRTQSWAGLRIDYGRSADAADAVRREVSLADRIYKSLTVWRKSKLRWLLWCGDPSRSVAFDLELPPDSMADFCELAKAVLEGYEKGRRVA